MLNETEILEKLSEGFVSRFGGDGFRFFFAPGRVNLIGEHTDYNGGHVFPCALSFGTYAVARKRDDDRVLLSSLNVGAGLVSETSVSNIVKSEGMDWTNYPKGVIWAFLEAGHKLPSGFEVLFYGNIPAGSGLSSSASLEVLTGLVLRELFELPNVSGVDLALYGQKAENDFVGMNCGIMDQFASAMGKENHAIYLDANTLKYEYAPLTMPDAKIVITNSAVKHQLASSEYNTRRAECEQAVREISAVRKIETLGELTPAEFEELKGNLSSDVLVRRARHAVTENARTLDAVNALKAGDIETFGKLMNASHDSLQYDYEVSCPEVDVLVAEGRKIPGVIGTRITGGGFGGCTVSIVKNEQVETFKETIGRIYKEKCGLDAIFYIASPGEGAHELK
ncbi:MAG: galactokinase [Lachnospiraceae bacterium]|nr:galactokinase [Lachnospiraceae bacterium]